MSASSTKGLQSKEDTSLRQALQAAIVKCSERCLYQSAKWAAEMLDSMHELEESAQDNGFDAQMQDAEEAEEADTEDAISSTTEDPEDARLEREELPRYLLAKSYFDCREFDRCAAVFLPMTLPKGEIPVSKAKPATPTTTSLTESKSIANGQLSQKALFLALYAQYMAGEKRRDEESETILGPQDGSKTANRELLGIQQRLKAWFDQQEQEGSVIVSQGWLEYLYGIVLRRQKNEKEAKEFLIRSVTIYQYNWGAWQELGDLINSVAELNDLAYDLPQGIIRFIFNVYQKQSLFQAENSVLQDTRKLMQVFPTSSFLKTQEALLYYHAKDYDTAESTFAQILQSDPLRLDYLEAYSNILFVMDKRPRLAFVAQVATSTDRFRPETCLAVGNYFARGSDHEKAIVYFRRALTLDRSYQAAWTLMGHEYLELRNTHAAVECYRRAIDINRKDFRAWYGLGQAYEFLEMHLYALHYFQQAAALSFPDAKIWQANGQCLDRLGRYQQAIKAYKRALLAGIGEDSPGAGRNKERPQYLDPEVTWLIAMDYDKLNDEKQIRHWLELTIAQEEGMLQRAEAESQSVFGASQSMAHSVMSTRTMAEEEDEKASGGTGVTATTSRARMWLARLEYVRATDQSMKRALQLANELCSDGYEVEEAKSLMKEIRARMGERWSNEVDREYME